MRKLLIALFLALLVVPAGFASAERDPQIIGGQTAAPGSWPFYAGLSKKGDFFCGGQLVDPEWVLTAAHCLESSFSGNRMTIGMHKLREIKTAPSIGSDRTYFYPKRKPFPFMNSQVAWDAALIHLRQPSSAPVIPLASESPAPGSQVMIGGFGLLDSFGFASPPIMQEVSMNTRSDESCQSAFGRIFKPGSMICFSRPRKGPCYGDSGGPAVFNGELVGITSYGKNGCANSPAVYTEAATIKPWVDQVIASGGQPGTVDQAALYEQNKKWAGLAVFSSQEAKRTVFRVTRKGCKSGPCPTEILRGRKVEDLEYISLRSIRLRPGRCARVEAEVTFAMPSGEENTVTRRFGGCNPRSKNR